MIQRLDALWKLLDQRRSGGPSVWTAAEVVRVAHDAGIAVEPSDLWDMGARVGFDFSESLVPPECLIPGVSPSSIPRRSTGRRPGMASGVVSRGRAASAG